MSFYWNWVSKKKAAHSERSEHHNASEDITFGNVSLQTSSEETCSTRTSIRPISPKYKDMQTGIPLSPDCVVPRSAQCNTSSLSYVSKLTGRRPEQNQELSETENSFSSSETATSSGPSHQNLQNFSSGYHSVSTRHEAPCSTGIPSPLVIYPSHYKSMSMHPDGIPYTEKFPSHSPNRNRFPKTVNVAFDVDRSDEGWTDDVGLPNYSNQAEEAQPGNGFGFLNQDVPFLQPDYNTVRPQTGTSIGNSRMNVWSRAMLPPSPLTTGPISLYMRGIPLTGLIPPANMLPFHNGHFPLVSNSIAQNQGFSQEGMMSPPRWTGIVWSGIRPEPRGPMTIAEGYLRQMNPHQASFALFPVRPLPNLRPTQPSSSQSTQTFLELLGLPNRWPIRSNFSNALGPVMPTPLQRQLSISGNSMQLGTSMPLSISEQSMQPSGSSYPTQPSTSQAPEEAFGSRKRKNSGPDEICSHNLMTSLCEVCRQHQSEGIQANESLNTLGMSSNLPIPPESKLPKYSDKQDGGTSTDSQ